MNPGRLIALAVGVLATTNGTIAAQCFLRLAGITGGSTDTNHVGWMEVQSANPAGIGNPSKNQPSFAEICLSKSVDAASPILAFRCASGALIPSGTMDFTAPGPTLGRYFRLNLTNILVSSVSQSSGGDVPQEQLCIAPLIYSWSYTQYRTNGLPAGYNYARWDIAANVGSAGTNQPAFVGLGVRKTNGVELRWNAIAGGLYRIYAVPALNQAFVPVAQLAATNTGETNYNFTPTTPAMFYTVEAVPNGH